MHETEIKEYLLKTPPFLQGFACLTLMSPRASHVQVCSRKPEYGSVPSALFLPTLRRTIPARAHTRTRLQTGLTVCRGYSLRTFNVETSTIVLNLEMSTIAGLFSLRSGRLEGGTITAARTSREG
jgi:hypothetical protein